MALRGRDDRIARGGDGDRIRANLDVRTDRCDRYGRPPARGVGVGVDGRGRRPGVRHRVAVAVRRGLRDDGLRGRGRPGASGAPFIFSGDCLLWREIRGWIGRSASSAGVGRAGTSRRLSFCAPKRSRRSGLPARRAGSIRGRSRTRKRAFGVGCDRSRQIPARSRDDRPGTAPNASRPRLPPFVTRQIDEKQKIERERRSSHAPPTVEGAEKGAAVGFLSSDGAIREVRESPRRFAARAPRQCRAARKPRGCSGSSLQLSRTPATRGGGARSPTVGLGPLSRVFLANFQTVCM